MKLLQLGKKEEIKESKKNHRAENINKMEHRLMHEKGIFDAVIIMRMLQIIMIKDKNCICAGEMWRKLLRAQRKVL